MNAKRNLCRLAAALMAIGSLTSLSGVALAEDGNAEYSPASLCGDYGAVVTYGANVRRGSDMRNLTEKETSPGPHWQTNRGETDADDHRFGISGTYSEQGRFRGQVLDFALPGGGTAHVNEAFVITISKSSVASPSRPRLPMCRGKQAQ